MSDAATTPANPVADPLMPDEQVAATITDAVPGTHADGKPTDLGEQVYAAVLVAIKRERNRCERVVMEIAGQLMAKAKEDADASELARLQGNLRGAQEMEARAAANFGIGQYLGRFLVLAVRLPPGECRRCLGRKIVPSRLAPGQGVPCPVCAAPPAEGAPST